MVGAVCLCICLSVSYQDSGSARDSSADTYRYVYDVMDLNVSDF